MALERGVHLRNDPKEIVFLMTTVDMAQMSAPMLLGVFRSHQWSTPVLPEWSGGSDQR